MFKKINADVYYQRSRLPWYILMCSMSNTFLFCINSTTRLGADIEDYKGVLSYVYRSATEKVNDGV